jgi:hypothetical protein
MILLAAIACSSFVFNPVSTGSLEITSLKVCVRLLSILFHCVARHEGAMFSPRDITLRMETNAHAERHVSTCVDRIWELQEPCY